MQEAHPGTNGIIIAPDYRRDWCKKGAIRMKPLTKLTVALSVFVVMTLVPAVAQDKKQGGMRARGIEMDYDDGRADGMRVAVKKMKEGEFIPVLATEEFKAGDRIKIEFESNFDGFVYIVNVAPSGKTCLLFPHPDKKDNKLQARQRYPIPPGPYSFRFNEEKGLEVLQVYMARQPIALFDETLKGAIDQNTKPCLGDSAMSAAKELANNASKSQQGGIESKSSPPIMAQAERKGSRPRGVELYLGEDSNKKESTIAVEKKDGSAQLRSGEFAFYEIRLKHN